MNNVAALVAAAVGALIFIIFVFSTYYTVGQGERAVITHYGAVVGMSEPGLHFKMPFVTGVEDISIQPQTYTYGEGNDPVQTYSRDQQPANMRLSVTFHITDPMALYTQFYSVDNVVARIITPRMYEQVKNIMGQFNAVEAIQERAKLNSEIASAVRQAVNGAPLMIDSVQVENIDFSDKYEKAVEDRMEATVRQQQAEAEKQRRMINADAAAYEVEAGAKARAHKTEVEGIAQATAIKARGDALRDNPNLPALVTAEKWDGHLPTTMPPGGTLPFLNLH